MEISFFKQQELKKARDRWRWSYYTAYVNAIFVACSGFFIADEVGHTHVGFDSISTTVGLCFALILAALAWGIQKRLSLICLWIFFLLLVLNAVYCASDPDFAKDAIGSAIVSAMLFRGILGVREIKRVMKETKQKQQSDDPAAQPAI